MQSDCFAVVSSRRARRRDLSKTSVGNRFARSRLCQQRLGEEIDIVTSANSMVLLALVYVQKSILALESVNCAKIGALSDSQCLIYEIVSNLRHDHFAQLQVRS